MIKNKHCNSKYVCDVQEKATKWEEGREIDGLTTNGVLIMHPQGKFCGGDSQPGFWREVSVGGGIFTLRESRSAQVKGNAVSLSLSAFRSALFFCIVDSNISLYHLKKSFKMCFCAGGRSE